MVPFSFTVVLPTVGRPTLERTLRSVREQELADGDEVLLVSDGRYPGLAARWGPPACRGVSSRWRARTATGATRRAT